MKAESEKKLKLYDVQIRPKYKLTWKTRGIDEGQITPHVRDYVYLAQLKMPALLLRQRDFCRSTETGLG
jgi:hypothetical protein